MSGFRQHLMLRMASVRVHGLALCLTSSVCLLGYVDPAFAQVSSGKPQIGTGAPSVPPFDPPVERPLASGSGMLSIDQWLLSPMLDLYTLYDTNIHSSPTVPLSGPGIRFHPGLLAELDTGLYDTKLYGNIDSTIYPTLNYLNNTFNRQAGAVETYAPLRDLTFTTHVDYTHNTNANVVITSIPTPITSSATPAPEGAAGVVAAQQTTVNPNDNYTATANVYKEFNRAFLTLGSSIALTQYEMSSSSISPNYYKEIYYGSAGFWFSPILFAFADAIDTNTIPAVGLVSNAYLARSGIGSAQIGLFQGRVYYGQQGTAVDQGGGTAGGDIYGGALSYFPSSAWDMSISVDRLRNRSDITGNTPGASGLPGLALSASNVTTASSTQITTIAFKSNYTISQQTSAYVVLSDSRIAFIDMPRVDNSWLASAGIKHQVRDNLSLSLDYQYTRYISEEPLTSFNRNLVSLGAHYKF